MTNTSMKVVLGMLFLAFSNADMSVADKDLTRRIYTAADALSTTKHMQIIDRKEFAKAALGENFKIFVVHIAFLNLAL